MGHVSRGRLRGEPLADVAAVAADRLGQLLIRRRPDLLERCVEAQRVTEPDQRHAHGTPKVAQYATDKLFELGLINLRHVQSPGVATAAAATVLLARRDWHGLSTRSRSAARTTFRTTRASSARARRATAT
jgi:hypothetical protein